MALAKKSWWFLLLITIVLVCSEYSFFQHIGFKPSTQVVPNTTLQNINEINFSMPKLGDGSRVLMSFSINQKTAEFNYGDNNLTLASGANSIGRCQRDKANGGLTCHLVLTIKEGVVPKLFFQNGTSLNVSKLSLSTLSKNNQLNYYPFFLWIAFGGLVFIFFFNLVVKNDVIKQWVIIGFVLLLLATLQPVYASFVFLFLYCFYLVGKFSAQCEGKERSKYVFSLIGMALLVLLMAKYGQNPIIALFSIYQDSYVLPLGISYFVIRMIDTILRWYKGELLEYNFRQFLFFILFPGTLLAGPIETLDKFYTNRVTQLGRDDFAYGLARIVLGLFKKIVIANSIFFPFVCHNYAKVATSPWGSHHGFTFIFLFKNLLYAYFDFSGYSDIAIGYSRLLGFRVIENFDYPIFANNLQEFWRRWHRSLSMWSFRNVYFPLILKLRSPFIPALLTMVTIGLWHNLGLSWLTWGLYQGAGLCFLTWLETKRKNIYYFNMKKNIVLRSIKRCIGIAVTLSFVTLSHSFVLFESYPIAIKTFFNALT